MPKKQFALEAGGPKRLHLKWKGIWKNMEVRLDEQLLGTVENQAMLKQGRSFALPDGSQLLVKLTSGVGAELQVSRDGVPLPGSGGDPVARVATAAHVMMFIGGFNIVLGVIAIALDSEMLQMIGLGLPSLIFGLVYAVLGFAVKKAHSLVALVAGTGLFVVDGLVTVGFAIAEGGRPGVGGIVVRVLLAIAMVKGIPALRELRAQAAQDNPQGF